MTRRRPAPLAVKIIDDEDIIGVVGPGFSGESDTTPARRRTKPVWSPSSASATDPKLSTNGWTTFHRVLGNDATQAPANAKYIKDTVGAKKAFVVDDASELLGKGIADGVRDDLGDLVTDNDTVRRSGPTSRRPSPR